MHRAVYRSFVVTLHLIVFLSGAGAKWLYYHVRQNPEMALSATGVSTARVAERLGPVFVKFAQMVSYRTDLLPMSFLLPLGRLQNRVKPEAFSLTRQTIESAFDGPLDTLFRNFEPDPIGSGSIATVFKAETLEGKQVAIKVVRIDAQRLIEIDISIARQIVRLITLVPKFKALPILENFERMASMLQLQSDMRKEAEHLTEMSKDHFIARQVQIPLPLRSMVDPRVFAMDYVESATDLSDSDIPEEHYREATIRVLRSLYRMIFETGLVHCDMHPGNILVGKDGNVFLIDAGLVSEISLVERAYFRDFFMGLAYGEAERCSDSILRSAISIPPTLDRQRFREDVRSLVEKYHGDLAGSFLVAEFAFLIFELQRHHKLYASSSFASVIWALATFEGLVRDRIPDLDFQAEAKPFIVGSIIASMRI